MAEKEARAMLHQATTWRDRRTGTEENHVEVLKAIDDLALSLSKNS